MWIKPEDRVPTDDTKKYLIYAELFADGFVTTREIVTAAFTKNQYTIPEGEFFPDWDGWLLDYGYFVLLWWDGNLPELPKEYK